VVNQGKTTIRAIIVDVTDPQKKGATTVNTGELAR
jgi:lipopolysaccharide export system protein LptA